MEEEELELDMQVYNHIEAFNSEQKINKCLVSLW